MKLDENNFVLWTASIRTTKSFPTIISFKNVQKQKPEGFISEINDSCRETQITSLTVPYDAVWEKMDFICHQRWHLDAEKVDIGVLLRYSLGQDGQESYIW